MKYKIQLDPRFYTLLVDALVIIVTYFVTKYFPVIKEDVLVVIGALQPLVILLLKGQSDAAKYNHSLPSFFQER